jgi:D-sedoheptulose 7-phosphate isomerase
MSLSTTSLAFLHSVHQAAADTQVDGPPLELRRMHRILLIGNGGSMAIASHIANDLVKTHGIDAIACTDPSVLTCLSNDFGYARVFTNWLNVFQEQDDTVIAISSSGRSPNIIDGCIKAKDRGRLITFTGFDADNPVRKLGHSNYWVPSHNYGVVECSHLAILHSIVNPG